MPQPQSVLPFRALGSHPGSTAPPGDSPQERLLRSGAGALNDAELLGLLLPPENGTAPGSLAAELLEHCGGFARLRRISHRDLHRASFSDSQKAVVFAALEIAKRLAKARLRPGEFLSDPAAIAEYLALRYLQEDQEVMGALYLDGRNRLVGEREIFRGTLGRAAVEPRALLKEALLATASGLVLWHTHPSGDPSPSVEDLAFTRRVAAAGGLLGIRLIDHIILGDGDRWVSLQRRGAW